jgi:Domain of unknown function (DUF6916)
MSLSSIQTFAAAANQSFDVAMGQASMPFTLVEVKPLPVHPYPGMLREPFSLIFRSESQVVLPQRLYSMRHAGLGKLDIFLVPVARDKAGVLYQAVFN